MSTSVSAAPALPSSWLEALITLRREFHQHPELSGEEAETAQRVQTFLTTLSPDDMITGIGGHGLAAIFDSGSPGKTLLLRCELDALPIHEVSKAPYRSTIAGKAHLCGHDGHMTILCGLAMMLAENRPRSGRVILLFQPSEEDGSGAERVLQDERITDLKPDLALSLHNTPGLPIGSAAIKSGPVCCASRGMKIRLSGRTAHASQPETGISPMPVLASLMPRLSAFSSGTTQDPAFRLVTVTHASLGEKAFGIAPGDAEIWATLRTLTDDHMEELCHLAETAARDLAQRAGLTLSIDYADIFQACTNAPEATTVLTTALDRQSIPWNATGLPWRPSEDFGRFGTLCPSAMVFLGAGEDTHALHNPDYDFPEALIGIGTRIFLQAVRDELG